MSASEDGIGFAGWKPARSLAEDVKTTDWLDRTNELIQRLLNSYSAREKALFGQYLMAGASIRLTYATGPSPAVTLDLVHESGDVVPVAKLELERMSH